MAERLASRYRTAFVTGASTGLGRAIAEMLLTEGVRVWGTSRHVERLGWASGRPEGEFTAVALDLRDGNGAEAVFRSAEGAAGGFDLMVNNAGASVFGPFAAVDFALWREQLDVMLINSARLAQAALRSLQSRNRGALVNVSSLAAEFPLPFQAAYNMAKAGMSALSESLMQETAGTGVVIIDLQPGDLRTGSEAAVVRPAKAADPRQARVWERFARLMQAGAPPEAAAAALRRALQRRRSGTVRCGPAFQSLVAPFLARFGSRALRRSIQSRYFDLT